MGWPGALAEKVLVPAWSVYRLPDTVDDRAGAMVEPGGNAWRAAAAAGAGPGETVLVWGPGTHRPADRLVRQRRRGGGARDRHGRQPRGPREDHGRQPLPHAEHAAVAELQRGHRLHRRRSGPRPRPAVRRAGRPDGLHRGFRETQPRRQPRPGAQRHHGGRHPRRVGRARARDRALRGRQAWTRRRSCTSSSASTAPSRLSTAGSIPAREPRSTSIRGSNESSGWPPEPAAAGRRSSHRTAVSCGPRRPARRASRRSPP